MLKLARVESVPHSNHALVARPLGITLPFSVAPVTPTDVAAIVVTAGGLPGDAVVRFLIWPAEIARAVLRAGPEVVGRSGRQDARARAHRLGNQSIPDILMRRACICLKTGIRAVFEPGLGGKAVGIHGAIQGGAGSFNERGQGGCGNGRRDGADAGGAPEGKYIRRGQSHGGDRFHLRVNRDGVVGERGKRIAGCEDCGLRRGVVRDHARKIPGDAAHGDRPYKRGRFHVLAEGDRDGIAQRDVRRIVCWSRGYDSEGRGRRSGEASIDPFTVPVELEAATRW